MRGPLTPSGASPRITQCRLPPAHFPHLFFSAVANNPFEHPPPSTNRHSVKTFRETRVGPFETGRGRSPSGRCKFRLKQSDSRD
ncbi:hypothetical protein TNIN_93191 [Trichonephila inaurata madagascariensis]|uniref:Uncharacterized protein n=1 Tax=Trichonephila inaurata madagascariensis TaxID=2747483 RepID=A0A8X6X576_9ARAC|nr:hypothetical protein TNIN_93191 [Trichonephila inaurata madagascariensis]